MPIQPNAWIASSLIDEFSTPTETTPLLLSYAESCIQYVKHPSKLKGLYPVLGSLGSHLDSALVAQAWVVEALRVSPFASTGKV